MCGLLLLLLFRWPELIGERFKDGTSMYTGKFEIKAIQNETYPAERSLSMILDRKKKTSMAWKPSTNKARTYLTASTVALLCLLINWVNPTVH